MEKRINKAKARDKRKKRIKKKIIPSSDRPRLCVFKSTKHIYAQVVDDLSRKVILSASTCSAELKNNLKDLKKSEKAAKVGELLAKIAKEKKIEKVVFDRSGYIYHGRVKALAEAARKGGLKF